MVVAAGADFMKLGVSNCIQLGMLEQAARLKPQAATAMTRFMIDTVHSFGRNGRLHNSLVEAGWGMAFRQCPCNGPSHDSRRERRKTRPRAYSALITVNYDLNLG